jgi:hypothetical protein
LSTENQVSDYFQGATAHSIAPYADEDVTWRDFAAAISAAARNLYAGGDSTSNCEEFEKLVYLP